VSGSPAAQDYVQLRTELRAKRLAEAGPCLFAHSVPVYPYMLAASSSLTSELVPCQGKMPQERVKSPMEREVGNAV